MACPSFQPAVLYSTFGDFANDVSLGDFNGDGFIDMAITNNGSNTISILLNNGDGTFSITPESPYMVGTNPNNVVASDLTGNGVLDLVVANTASASITTLFNNGNGIFNAINVPVGAGPFAIAAADFNGDGFPDLAITNSGASNNINILLNNGDGTFTEAPGSPVPGFSGSEKIVARDFNGDGMIDLAVANLFSGDISVLFGNGNGTFQPIVNYFAGGGPNGLTSGDFNGDGFPDLIVTQFFSNTITVLLNDGFGGFSPQVPIVVGDPGSGPVDVTVADFNCDGILDAAVNLFNSSQTVILLGDGTGMFTPTLTLNITTPSGILSADLDGNGTPDLAIPNFVTNGTVSVLLNNCQPTISPVISGPRNTEIMVSQGVSSATFSYEITAEGVCGVSSITCNGVERVFFPAKKTIAITETMEFPLGTTLVTCTARDAFGNISLPYTFTVTVISPNKFSSQPHIIRTTRVLDWTIVNSSVTIRLVIPNTPSIPS